MDPEDTILMVIREKVGCNGLRSFADLGKMRQDTLEKRLNAANRKLGRGNMASVYAMWLRDQINRIGGTERKKTVTTFSRFLYTWDCSLQRSLDIWDDCTRCTVKGLPRGEQERVLRQMEAVRSEITQGYPDPKSSMPRLHTTQLTSRPRSIDSLRPASAARSSKSRSRENIEPPKRPASSNYKQSRRSSPVLIDLTDDPEPAPSSLKVEVKLPKSPTLVGSTAFVPNKYTCKRCGVKGHFIQECPTNADPAWDLRPKTDYVCHSCGRKGDHYITSCPRRPSKEEATVAHPSQFQIETGVNDQLELYPRQDSRDGRLSPWENSTYQPNQVTEAEQDGIHDQPEAQDNALSFLDQLDELIRVKRPDAAEECYLDRNEPLPSDMRRPPSKKQKTRGGDGNGMASEAVDVSMVDISEMERSACDDHLTTKSWESERSDYESDLDYARCLEEGIFEHSSTPASPEPPKPVVPYVTRKPLVKEPPYSGAIHGMFFFKKNVWIKSSQRTTALKMWDARED